MIKYANRQKIPELKNLIKNSILSKIKRPDFPNFGSQMINENNSSNEIKTLVMSWMFQEIENETKTKKYKIVININRTFR